MFVGAVWPCLPNAHKPDAALGSALGAATQKQPGAQRMDQGWGCPVYPHWC